MSRPLWEGFLRSSAKFPDRPALYVRGETLSYEALRRAALGVASTLQKHGGEHEGSLTAVFAHRSVAAFSGVLGSLLSGHGYVPLNPTFPADRNRIMFERSGCRTIVVDSECLPLLDGILDGAPDGVLVIAPNEADVSDLTGRWPRHTFLGQNELEGADSWSQPPSRPDDVAYLLFTSGSTGVPKGVMVAHRNVVSFIDYMVELYGITEQDRFSQMFDMTFDLSVFDMFVCWERGAMLCCPSPKTLMKPGRFIQEMGLTIWFSVPSTAIFMKQLGMLKPDRYPSLRYSLFCGEPLPVASVQAWQQAAPNSVLENLYGPTELTIACTRYRWSSESSLAEAEMDIVPIGDPYPGMEVLVADESLREVSAGEVGELLMSGPQVTLGYWRDTQKTDAAFVIPPEKTDLFYRTGDRVRRSINGRPMTHLGRVDFQVKVLGHRVELGEVEAVLRRLSGFDGVVAVGWPSLPSGFGGIEVFIEGRGDGGTLRSGAAEKLPEYMMPRRIHFLDRIPRNVNDKFDRSALMEMLAEG